MASPVYSGPIRGSRPARGRYRPMSEINVTPLVDVMLVLLVVSVNRDGVIFVAEASVATDALVPKLQAITGANPDAVIYVRGDKQLNYGRVLEVMSLVSSAGFRKVSLVAEAPKGPAAANRPGTSVRR